MFSFGYYIRYFQDSSEIEDIQQEDIPQQNNKTQQIPFNILSKYEELDREYKDSFGAAVEFCIKDSEEIYKVWGSGGYTGVTFYYAKDGTEIDSYYWDDVIEPNEPKPPINILEYNCTTLKKSE